MVKKIHENSHQILDWSSCAGMSLGESSLVIFEKPKEDVAERAPPPIEPVVVAVMGDFESDRWKALKNGIDLAFTKFDLEEVSVFYEDTVCDAQTAEAKFAKLQTMSVDMIIGGLCSDTSSKIAELSQANQVVFANSSDPYSNLIGLGDYVFRTVTPFAEEVRFAA
jgi:hypothetical protein